MQKTQFRQKCHLRWSCTDPTICRQDGCPDLRRQVSRRQKSTSPVSRFETPGFIGVRNRQTLFSNRDARFLGVRKRRVRCPNSRHKVSRCHKSTRPVSRFETASFLTSEVDKTGVPILDTRFLDVTTRQDGCPDLRHPVSRRQKLTRSVSRFETASFLTSEVDKTGVPIPDTRFLDVRSRQDGCPDSRRQVSRRQTSTRPVSRFETYDFSMSEVDKVGVSIRDSQFHDVRSRQNWCPDSRHKVCRCQKSTRRVSRFKAPGFSTSEVDKTGVQI